MKAWYLVALGVLSMVLSAGLLLSIYDQVYTGSDVTFRTEAGRKIIVTNVNSSTVGMMGLKAASDKYFLLRMASGEMVVGSRPVAKGEKPLGWKADSYYLAPLQSVPAGEWLVIEGSDVTVQLSGGSGSLFVWEVEVSRPIWKWAIFLTLGAVVGLLILYFLISAIERIVAYRKKGVKRQTA